MALFLAIGIGVAGLALGTRFAMQAYKASKNRVAQAATSNSASSSSVIGGFMKKKFYEGGFLSEMTRAEAALILGVRQSMSKDKIKLAHRRIMLANHPDNGGSDYLASKINEAKELLLNDDEDKQSM